LLTFSGWQGGVNCEWGLGIGDEGDEGDEGEKIQTPNDKCQMPNDK